MKISNPKFMLQVNIQSREFVYLIVSMQPADGLQYPRAGNICPGQNSSSISHIDRVPMYS